MVGLAGGAHVDCPWGKAQADVGCCMAALCPAQCCGCGFMEGPLWQWWVVRGKLTLQQLLWQCMSTPCSTLHTL